MNLPEALRTARYLRFLCTGNVVRSAFAELWARHLGCPLPVDSAASSFQNAEIFPETRAALLERGVAPALLEGFRPRHLSRLDLEDPPGLVVFGMGEEHLRAWRVLRPEPGPSFLLSEVLGDGRRIPDPVMDGAPFDATFEWVASCVEGLVARLPRAR